MCAKSRLGLVLVLVALWGLGGTGTAEAARGLSLGFVDSAFQPAGSGGGFPSRLSEARGLGASTARTFLFWPAVAPAPPRGDPADPAAAGYRWESVDATVRETSARGLRLLLTFTAAPPWAEGPRRPPSAPRGTWRPDAGALRSFATAAARRYSGRYPDPARPGRVLPRVSLWQVWNEPNLPDHLSPQWTGRGRGARMASPGIYRGLLNAGYAGVKSVSRSNTVLTAGTAPYGDSGPGGRIRPVAFLRSLLCLKGRGLRAGRCPSRARFDVLTHHPYGVRGARSHALNRDDVAIPDLGKLTRVVRAAVRKRRVLPRRSKSLWITEVSWDSRPPDPQGVPASTHARWLAESFYLLWRAGARTITWFQVRDQLPNPSFAATYQSGVLFADGRPKPAAQAYRFPFVLDRRGRRQIAWGRAPAAGRVTVQVRRGGRWRRARALRVGRGLVFQTRLRSRRGTLARAVQGGQVSRPYRSR